MENLKDYVLNNYRTESTTSIGMRFNVNRQTISQVLRKLNKDGLININESYCNVNSNLTPKQLEQKRENHRKWYEKKKLVKSVVVKGSRSVSVPLNGEPKKAFKNHEGLGKMECRKIVSKFIGEIPGRYPKILTLPCDKWLWEKEVLSQKPESKFVGVEYDNDVFNRMVSTYVNSPELQKSVVGLHNCSMWDVIRRSEENEYNHMILDYCGIINSFKDEIDEVMTRNLVKVGGIISITLSLTGRHNNDGGKEINNILTVIPKDIFGLEMSDCSFSTKLSISTMVLKQDGRYKLDEVIEYNDTTPMLLFVIRRMK